MSACQTFLSPPQGGRRGEKGARASFALPFVSLLPPHFLLCVLAWPLHFPTPTSLSQSGVYHSGWIRALYLAADLSLLHTATVERKTLNPCLLASLPFLCTHKDAHTHTHTFTCLLSPSNGRGQQRGLHRWAAAARGWRAASTYWLPPSLSTRLQLTCCLPEAFACLRLTAPAPGTSVSKLRTRGNWKVFLLQRYPSLHAPNSGSCQ